MLSTSSPVTFSQQLSMNTLFTMLQLMTKKLQKLHIVAFSATRHGNNFIILFN